MINSTHELNGLIIIRVYPGLAQNLQFNSIKLLLPSQFFSPRFFSHMGRYRTQYSLHHRKMFSVFMSLKSIKHKVKFNYQLSEIHRANSWTILTIVNFKEEIYYNTVWYN